MVALNSFLFYSSSTDLVERHRERQRQREKPNLLFPLEHKCYLVFSFLHLTPKKAQSKTTSKPMPDTSCVTTGYLRLRVWGNHLGMDKIRMGFYGVTLYQQ